MVRKSMRLAAAFALAFICTSPCFAVSRQAATAPSGQSSSTPMKSGSAQSGSTKSSSMKSSSTAGMPTDAQIADAKAKGMVWANSTSKVYHKDDRYYGKTKNGEFMTEADAQKAGYHLAKSSPVGQTKSSSTSTK
jgi:hypothetical protein